MYIPIEKHRKVVGYMGGVIFLLLFLFLLLFFQVGPFANVEETLNVPPQLQTYLKSEEAFIVPSGAGSDGESVVLPIEKVLFEYIEIIDSCNASFKGDCVNIRSGPGKEFPVVTRIRNGAVLKVGGKVEYRNETWYKIAFNEWLRYPERAKGDWFVSADFVRVLYDEGEKTFIDRAKDASKKKIIVDRSEQRLYAYEGDLLFMEEAISTGVELTPTPRGNFTIFKKTPSRYMQGPIPGITEKNYDLPGVPWNLYFTSQGAVIHGTYWHENFGKPSSNGCVNVRPSLARELYTWAEVGTRVVVQD